MNVLVENVLATIYSIPSSCAFSYDHTVFTLFRFKLIAMITASVCIGYAQNLDNSENIELWS